MIMNKISSIAQQKVREATRLRFGQGYSFKTPEALILYEQGLLDEKVIHNLCEETYGIPLEEPKRYIVPKELDELFRESTYIVIYVDNMVKEVHIANIPEQMSEEVPQLVNATSGYKIIRHNVSIIWYILHYQKVYGYPEFLHEMPVRDLFDFIINEAIELKVMDTTITSGNTRAQVYHQINLLKVNSKRKITNHDVNSLVRIMCYMAGDSIDPTQKGTKRIGVSLNKDYRGRVEITPTIHGYLVTTRLLPNTYFNYTLDDIHIDERTKAFFRKYSKDIRKPGARIIAGATGSGKNTTIFSIVKEILDERQIKVVSLEQPVELLMEGMEQIEALTNELFEEYSRSLIRHNPDLVYFSEITDRTANEFMKIANTGKSVITTIHTNSASTIISRLVDLTGLSIDRIIQDIHSLTYQSLVRHRKYGVMPKTSCILFSDTLKQQLLGKTIGEVTHILDTKEKEFLTMSPDSIEQGMLEI